MPIKGLHIDDVGYVKSGTYNPALFAVPDCAVVENDLVIVAIVLPARSCILAVEGDKVIV